MSKDLEKLMEDDLAAKSALKGSSEIETLASSPRRVSARRSGRD